MKKMVLVPIFLVLAGFLAFSQTGHEIDHLLFMPNSSDQFIDHAEVMIHLDGLARDLIGRNLVPGQILVYGYFP